MEQGEENLKTATGGVDHKTVQTYAEDIAGVIEGDRGEGLIKKIIHESEEKEIEKINLSPESKKNKFFLGASSALILAGLATLFFFIFNKNIATIPVEEQVPPIIFIDKSSFLEVKELKKEVIAQTVRNVVNTTEVKPGGVEAIYLTLDKQTAGLREFVSLIKGNFSPDKNLVSDNFLMGVVNNETKDFFILLKMRSVPDIFDSLRSWEDKMFIDLQGFFGVEISPETKILLTKSFEDGIIENKNARILYDNNHKISMMYVFADDNSIIITGSEVAAREVMLRLAAGQIKK